MVSPLKLFCRLATAFTFLIITTTSPITAQEQSGTGWHYDGDSILTLSGSEVAWKDLSSLKSSVRKVIFADDYDIPTIPQYAFEYFDKLEEINLPDIITNIGTYAFTQCSSLRSIVIPDKVTSIGLYTFAFCTSLKSVTLPDNISVIGEWAFRNCESLTSVKLPDNLISVEKGAFSYCYSLSSISFPSGLVSIGDLSFMYSNITSASLHNLEYLGSEAFLCCKSLASVSFDSLETINEGAFNSCSALSSLTLPSNLKSIEKYAFYCCEALTSVTLPSSLERIKGCAFFYHALQSVEILSDGTPDNKHFIYLGDGNDKTSSCNVDQVFPAYTSATLIYDPNTTWIGDDDTQNLRYYFRSFATPTSISTPTDATTSTPQFFDLNGRPVSPSSHKGLTIKRQDGHSSLISTK